MITATMNVYLRYKILKKSFYILLLSQFLGMVCGFSQAKTLSVLRHISTKNGLAGSIIKYIYQDKQGLIWLNTNDGLQRFDGSNFLSIRYEGWGNSGGLPSGIMNYGITEDKEGNIWATTEHEGPVKYDKQTGTITSFNHLVKQHEMLRSHAVTVLRDSSILVSSINGTYIIKNNNIRSFFSDPWIEKNKGLSNQKGIQQDKRGNIWIATASGIALLDVGGQWHSSVSNKKDYKILNHSFDISSLLMDKDERLWYSNWEWNNSNKRFLYRYNWRKNTIDSVLLPNNYTNESDEYYNIVAALEEDKEGNIWLLTHGGHIFIYNSSMQLIEDISSFEYNNRLIQPEQLTAIHCDNDGFMWIGYEEGIIITKRMSASQQEQFILPSSISLQADITTLVPSSTPLLLNQQFGLARWELLKKKFTPQSIPFLHGKWKNYLNHIATHNDTMFLNPWFSDEVILFDANKNRFSPYIPKGKLKHLLLQAVCDEKQIIFSANNSLHFYSYDGRLLDSIFLQKKSSLVSSMDIDRNNILLVIDTSAAITSIDLAKRKIISTVSLPALKGRRYRIKQVGNYYLIGTLYQGIQVFNRDGTFFKNISSKDGLLSNNILDIHTGADGLIWIETTNGFNYFKDAEQLAVFTVPELDMAYNNFKQAVYDKKHGFYFLYPGHITHIPYLSLESTGRKPFLFTSIQSSEGTLSTQQQKTSIAWQNNSISFEFAAVDYIHAGSMQYRYRLNGKSNDDWIISGSSNKAIFSKLKPGHYIFEAQYRHSNGNWQGATLQYEFHVKQPFWKQWWFISSIVLLLTAIASIYFRKDYLSKKKIGVLRWQLARDLHDEVGSTLSSINIYSSVLENRIVTEKDKFIAKEIKEKATDSIQNMSDIIWAIQPGNDSLKELVHRFKNFAIPLAEAAGIQLELNHPEEELSLDMLQRRNIFLFLKEAFTNGLRHAVAKKIHISFQQQKNLLIISYADDGKGFSLEKLTRKSGLANMQQRIEELKGKFFVEAAAANGCGLTAIIPV